MYMYVGPTFDIDSNKLQFYVEQVSQMNIICLLPNLHWKSVKHKLDKPKSAIKFQVGMNKEVK